LPHFQTILSAT